MTNPTVAIIGYGFVGKAMGRLFPGAVIYDPLNPRVLGSERAEINRCDVAFVCVPTPQAEAGACDTSIVEETVGWLETPLIIIRSTIAPGTTDQLSAAHPHKRIVFMPEYVGETTAHPLLDERARTFLIFGGKREDCERAARVFQGVYNASVKIMFLSATEAEIVKYMENTAIAAMVTLCNEFFNICRAFGVGYDMVREAFLLDPRMSRYFTFVYPDERGFDGKCLPKDLNAIVYAAIQAGYRPGFIADILKNNERIRHDG